MALFGKKKGDAPENNQGLGQNAEASKTESGAFDFDSIARDLEAENGPSPFDDLLSKPAAVDPFDMGAGSKSEGSKGGSAFDFPDSADEDEATDGLPERKVVASSSNDLDNLDDLFGTSAAPDTPSSDSFPDIVLSNAPIVEPVATPATATVVSEQPPTKTKKPFPLVPALGALAVLVIAGGAGWYFSQSPPEEEPTPIVVPTRKLPEIPVGASEPVDPSTLPDTTVVKKQPAVPPRPAAVNPSATAATVDNPETLTRLKNLWEQGKDAKARGDYASARKFWELALTIKPGHPGFQESIDKLPPTR
jgi:hypothetical protein